MNKKVFTLLAASLVLFMTVFTANAGRPWVGENVRNLPEGTGKGAYHLKVTHIGKRAVKDSVLIMDRFGYVDFADSTYLWKADSAYIKLRSSLWCVTVKKKGQEFQGRVPVYTFVNKEYGAEMAFDKMGFTQDTYSNSIHGHVPGVDKIVGQEDLPLVGGPYAKWKFSRTYNTVALETDQYLAIDLKSVNMPDYYMTFAVPQSGSSAGKLRLVIAHKNEFNPGTPFWDKELVRFTLKNASPRVLTAEDFNTKLHQNAKSTSVQMFFNPDVTKDQKNPFAQELEANDNTNPGGDNNYVTLKSKSGYLKMSTKAYHNASGIPYPVIVEDSKTKTGNQCLWRLVYYPSEDSLIVNVKGYKGHTNYVDHEDNGVYNKGEKLYNQEIWDFLIVRMQDLDGTTGKRVITVANKPANTRIYFKINNCELFDTDRTTVPTDLYTIQDKDGNYLVVPLYAGSFTPQWIKLDENEVANMTPSCQWFVKQVNDGSEISKVHLVNREMNDIQIEYVQLYNSYHVFNGVWTRLNPNKSADYSPVMGRNLVKADGFVRVPKPYRDDPYLGYRNFAYDTKKMTEALGAVEDSLNWFAYSFNHLTGFGKDFYLGYTEKNKDKQDTLLYGIKGEKTYFRLELPDPLRKASAYGMEPYGIGHKKDLPKKFTKEGADYIAPLFRCYYYLKINDYWKFDRNDNYVVLDKNGRYGYTPELNINQYGLRKAKFYLRFTYQVDDVDYYTFIQRIDKSDFDYVTDVLDVPSLDTIQAYDHSHGSITTPGYGVLVGMINKRDPNYFRAQTKIQSGPLDAFSISRDTEPLYRRFDTNKESAQANDNPDTLKFFRSFDPKYYVYEDAHSVHSYTKKQLPKLNYSSINFMGVENIDDAVANQGKDQAFKRHLETDYAIYVDTAYVNRGTGHIKPQYMLVVDPQFGPIGCPKCDEYYPLNKNYLYGRFLRNMTDSAYVDPNNPTSKVRDKDYIDGDKWVRLAFVPAIHVEDSLYILNSHKIEEFLEKGPNEELYLNYKLLNKASIKGNVVKVMLDNNLHKDEVFSFRYLEPGGNLDRPFLIESETKDRNSHTGAMIAPLQGGWVKFQNDVPVISRGAYKDHLGEADVWNVAMTDKAPLANNEVEATDVVVVAGVGYVNVRNAAGKQVTVSNILGQTVARVVLTSDNETITAPKGVVVVAIEGENAVKAVVK